MYTARLARQLSAARVSRAPWRLCIDPARQDLVEILSSTGCGAGCICRAEADANSTQSVLAYSTAALNRCRSKSATAFWVQTEISIDERRTEGEKHGIQFSAVMSGTTLRIPVVSSTAAPARHC